MATLDFARPHASPEIRASVVPSLPTPETVKVLPTAALEQGPLSLANLTLQLAQLESIGLAELLLTGKQMLLLSHPELAITTTQFLNRLITV
eukprot:CAMPEP_0115323182 /NCGR_PEP_ID=MMETSP0270-20121206/81803_1 /TAXON_ID=71861 /ORGANISM="Scrippsiella trochoidea, Strain CCMP3099" /LENGTH=91 /DNA_ID=CAMNT_0002743205 /DNA_START=140 /DNA_END=416 /DNA_ORIENTATION=+